MPNLKMINNYFHGVAFNAFDAKEKVSALKKLSKGSAGINKVLKELEGDIKRILLYTRRGGRASIKMIQKEIKKGV